MKQLSEFFGKLFQADSWPAGLNGSPLSEFHGWLSIGSNFAIAMASFVISFLLVKLLREKPTVPFHTVFLLFAAFLFFCGLTYLMNVIYFWWPAHRLSTLLSLVTAIISWITIVAVYKYLPVAKSMKTPHELEAEITKHTKSELKFMNLLESAPDAKVITDGEGKILLVNAQTEQIFGFQREELIGKDIEILIPERFHQIHIVHRNEYIEHPKVRAMGIGKDLFGKRKEGSEFPVEISLSPLKLTGEDGIMIISSIRNITERKETEAEIKKLNENLEALVIERTTALELALEKEKTACTNMYQNQFRLAFLTEASNVLASSLIYTETLTNLAQMVCPAIADWCAIDEIEEDGMITRIVVTHIDPEKVQLVYDLAKKHPPHMMASQGIYEVVKTRQSKLYHTISDELIQSVAQDEEHLRIMQQLELKSAIVVPLHNRDKIYGVITLALSKPERLFDEKDLEFANELGRRTTLAIENAKLYKKMQDNNAELEQRVARRTVELEAINKELEAFSYSVSHDLRAPLRSIDGFSNKILKDYGNLLDEQGKDYFRRVKNASQHMGNLIDDLIKLARISRIEINTEMINLSVMAQSIADELKESNTERTVSFIIQQDMKAVGDKNLLQIALQNLLENAWKYTRNEPSATIEFGLRQEPDKMVYFIRDNGVGFDMKYADKLFGAFQRLHSHTEFEGTGIGLATVQRIIRRHHGTIWAESEVNKGTTFFFTL